MWGAGTFCYSLLNIALKQEILVRNFCDLVSSLHNALNGECRTRIGIFWTFPAELLAYEHQFAPKFPTKILPKRLQMS
jgi:hypothetical protein